MQSSQLTNNSVSNLYKIIKIYKIEGQRSTAMNPHQISQSQLGQQPTQKSWLQTVKLKTSQICEKLKAWLNWSSIQTLDINQNFFLFPNQSIYKQGIRISYKQKMQFYQFELIKSKWNINLGDCFCYQYQVSIYYDNPIPMLRSFGYNHNKRKSKAATVFKSLKFGIEIIVYHLSQKEDFNDQMKKGKIQIILTGVSPYNVLGSALQDIEDILGELVVKPLENQLQHQKMTLKNLGGIEQYK